VRRGRLIFVSLLILRPRHEALSARGKDVDRDRGKEGAERECYMSRLRGKRKEKSRREGSEHIRVTYGQLDVTFVKLKYIYFLLKFLAYVDDENGRYTNGAKLCLRK